MMKRKILINIQDPETSSLIEDRMNSSKAVPQTIEVIAITLKIDIMPSIIPKTIIEMKGRIIVEITKIGRICLNMKYQVQMSLELQKHSYVKKQDLF